MPITLYDSSDKDRKKPKPQTSVVIGTVTNNCDIRKQGKVQVRIPSLDQEVWARMASVGAGAGAGFYYVPRADDEVLVALNENEPEDACIIGGMWNSQDTPPVDNALESTTKRVIKTGTGGGQGHTIEFDDGVGQSITISTMLGHTITMDKTKIELSTVGGTLKITMDTTQQTITIDAPQIQIGTENTLSVTIKGSMVTVGSQDSILTSVEGEAVFIN